MKIKNSLASAALLLLIGAGCDMSGNANVTTTSGTPAPGTPYVEDDGSGVGVDVGAGGSMDMRIAGKAISIGAQRPGAQLVFEEVQTDKPTFLVVHEGGTVRGAIIGTSGLIQAAAGGAVTVTLSRPSVNGETLYVEAVADD